MSWFPQGSLEQRILDELLWDDKYSNLDKVKALLKIIDYYLDGVEEKPQ